MQIAIPAEIKDNEFRVAITPVGVRELTSRGHQVFVQEGAGLGSSISDDRFRDAGARILGDADETWGVAGLVLKVKEPIAEEYARMREGQVLFTYLPLAADPTLAEELLPASPDRTPPTSRWAWARTSPFSTSTWTSCGCRFGATATGYEAWPHRGSTSKSRSARPTW
ncbi:hypothetical protein JCM18899A_39010 [Nocardioides sp. AN3]